MTSAELLALVVAKTDLPKVLVQQVLAAERDVIRFALFQRQEVVFHGLYRISAKDEKRVVRNMRTGLKRVSGRIVLHIRPLKALRAELNRWSSEAPVEKYGVSIDSPFSKTAASEGRPCPDCGGLNVDYKGTTPHCPKCGTLPWESTDGRKAETKR